MMLWPFLRTLSILEGAFLQNFQVWEDLCISSIFLPRREEELELWLKW
jgi:hypothetical protein